MNVCDVSVKRKGNENQSSSNLRRCCLGHISRGGGVEQLTKNEILCSLGFLDFDQYINCIKEK